MVFAKDEVLKNYYDILGIPPTATKEQIKSAYRKLSIKFHPDKNNGEEFFESMFKSINEAHEILMDDRKRANYDFQLKNFNDTKNDYSNQAHIRRKEEEIRRKQEELLRREQELRQKEFHQTPERSRPQESTETDWGKVSNVFLLLNVILVLLIFLTPRSDERTPTVKTPLTGTKKERTRTQSNYKKSTTSAATISDSLDYNTVYSTDTTQDIQVIHETEKTSDSLIETETTGNNKVLQRDTEQVDTIEEKPKWFQFKKKRELKKKNQKEKED